MAVVVIFGLLLATVWPTAVSAAPAAPESVWSSSGPVAVPDAPRVSIQRGPSAICSTNASNVICLYWPHVGQDAAFYEIYRSNQPYPQPGVPPANRIMDLPAGAYGQGSTVSYLDDGLDNYAGDGTIATVQVVGDVQNNYFWVVQSRSGSNETSGGSNWVGEFDFSLTKGS